MHSTGFVCLASIVLIAVDSGDVATKKDLEKFQGNWQLISMERDGKKTPPEDVKKSRCPFKATSSFFGRMP
jgi:hypothetical protein